MAIFQQLVRVSPPDSLRIEFHDGTGCPNREVRG
jgi:hypothetical protein